MTASPPIAPDTGSAAEWRALLRRPVSAVGDWLDDMDSQQSPPDRPGSRRQVAVVMITVAAVLITLDEFASSATGRSLLASRFDEKWETLVGMVWWALVTSTGYILVPVLVVRFLLPDVGIRDLHLRLRSPRASAWTVGPALAVMGPVVWLVSRDPGFSSTYPLYPLAGRSATDYLVWTGVYVLQFVALEFFFRGFLLAATRRTLGSNAIWVMVVPYTMVHLYKPYLEGLGAIAAGTVLGLLAMRHRSIWDGVALHVSVALFMDALAL